MAGCSQMALGNFDDKVGGIRMKKPNTKVGLRVNCPQHKQRRQIELALGVYDLAPPNFSLKNKMTLVAV